MRLSDPAKVVVRGARQEAATVSRPSSLLSRSQWMPVLTGSQLPRKSEQGFTDAGCGRLSEQTGGQGAERLPLSP